MTDPRDPRDPTPHPSDPDAGADNGSEAGADGADRVVPFSDEAELGRRLAGAGPRPELPEEDLKAIAGAAHAAWRRSWGHGATPGAPPPSGSRDLSTGRLFALAAAAALVAGALGLGVFWATMTWMSADAGAARVVAVRGAAQAVADPVEGEPDGGHRSLADGDRIAWDEVVTVAAEGGAALDLRLDGGVELRLAPGSRLAFRSGPGSEAPFEAFFHDLAELFTPRRDPVFRLALERGALYVDTGRHDSPRSRLAVDTPLGTVRDVGTRFSVRLLTAPGSVAADGGPSLQVRVRSGAVVLEAAGTEAGRAAAGEELLVAADGRVARHPTAAFGDTWRWAVDEPPAFHLEGATVDAFLCWVSGETGWELRYADPQAEAAAKEIVLHGDLGGLAPDRAAFALLPGAGMTAELQDGALVVRRAADGR